MQLKPTVLKFILGFLDVLSSGVESTEGSVVTGSIDIESEASAGVSVVLGSIDYELNMLEISSKCQAQSAFYGDK